MEAISTVSSLLLPSCIQPSPSHDIPLAIQHTDPQHSMASQEYVSELERQVLQCLCVTHMPSLHIHQYTLYIYHTLPPSWIAFNTLNFLGMQCPDNKCDFLCIQICQLRSVLAGITWRCSFFNGFLSGPVRLIARFLSNYWFAAFSAIFEDSINFYPALHIGIYYLIGILRSITK